jgi:hypothetical protein
MDGWTTGSFHELQFRMRIFLRRGKEKHGSVHAPDEYYPIESTNAKTRSVAMELLVTPRHGESVRSPRRRPFVEAALVGNPAGLRDEVVTERGLHAGDDFPDMDASASRADRRCFVKPRAVGGGVAEGSRSVAGGDHRNRRHTTFPTTPAGVADRRYGRFARPANG